MGDGEASGREDIGKLLDRVEAEALNYLFGGRALGLGERLVDLAGENLRGRPWAALVVATGLHELAPDSPAVSELLDDAIAAFTPSGDELGLAFAEFVLGNVARRNGDLAVSNRRWASSRRRLDTVAPGGVPLGQSSLVLFATGDIEGSKQAAQLEVLAARLADDVAAEVGALVLLAYFHLSQGCCAAVEGVLLEAEAVVATTESIEPRSPLLIVLAWGAVASLRGQREVALATFAAGVEIAVDSDDAWNVAVARCMRGEYAGHWEPALAMADGRAAIAVLTKPEDGWWYDGALRAMGIGALSAGDLASAVELFRRSLLGAPPPIDLARAKVRLADALLLRARDGDVTEAIALLTEAEAELEAMSASYWLAWALLLHAAAEPAAAHRLRTRAVQLRTDDPSFAALFGSLGSLTIRGFGTAQVLVAGRPAVFKTHNAEAAVILLADAGPDGLSAAALAAALWPDADERQAAMRVKDVVHSVRIALGRQAWRLEHRRKHLTLDMTNASFDVADALAAARSVQRGGSPAPWTDVEDLLEALERPLLPRWSHAEWVDPIVHRVAARAVALRRLA